MRHWTLKVAMAVGLILVVILLALSGAAFLMVAAYLFFASLWGKVVAALVVAAISFTLAGISIWSAVRITR